LREAKILGHVGNALVLEHMVKDQQQIKVYVSQFHGEANIHGNDSYHSSDFIDK
jgi:hypothetical protein